MTEVELQGAEQISRSFRSQAGGLFYFVGIFFFNFLCRIVFSPLMPTIEKDLRLSHGEAGSLFFLMYLGYCIMLLASGFVSSRLRHRGTILLSSVAVGGALLMISISHQLWTMSFWLIALGMAAGLYLPSGIATITELVSPKDWGKAIAIHELAPNLGFAIAPLLTEVLMGWFAWRQILMLLGLASILMGILFALFGKGGASPGEAPNFKILRSISADRSFWIMMVLFSLGLGCGLGLYGMIPLYLVSERGMERAWANTLLALSRILTTAMPIVSGWATDRLGSKNTLKVVLLTTSLLTAMLGLMPGSWVVLIVFLQPIAATSFFPPGFAALSQWAPQNTKNVAVSLTTPIASFLGSGAVPAGLGFMGEVGSFSMGFVILGGLLLGGALLVRYLKFQE